MTQSTYTKRLELVRADLKQWNVDALLVGSPANRRWLSGFTGSAGWLLVTPEKALLATDFRYWDQANQQALEFELFKVRKQMSQTWKGFFNLIDMSAVGVEANHLSVQQKSELEEAVTGDIVPIRETVEPHRSIKGDEEIAAIRKAASITDQAMLEVKNLIQPGMTENEIAWKLEKIMRDNGADSLAFPVIVASGPNGAMAHHTPGERVILEGDPFLIDMGARLDGYNSDLTRSFIVGKQGDQRFQEIYNLVLHAQEAALEGLKAGISGRSADRLARDVIEDGGYGDEFGHSLGHGIGLEVHEDPRLSHTGETKNLPAGSVVTVEPGVYIRDWGGIRIEDLVVVTAAGVEIVSKCPKEPIVPLK